MEKFLKKVDGKLSVYASTTCVTERFGGQITNPHINELRNLRSSNIRSK